MLSRQKSDENLENKKATPASQKRLSSAVVSSTTDDNLNKGKTPARLGLRDLTNNANNSVRRPSKLSRVFIEGEDSLVDGEPESAAVYTREQEDQLFESTFISV